MSNGKDTCTISTEPTPPLETHDDEALEHIRSPIKSKAKTALSWATSLLMDSLFLAVWFLAQSGVGRLAKHFPAEGADNYAIVLVQCLFAISTIIPIILYIYQDTFVMYYRTKANIQKAKNIYNSITTITNPLLEKA